MAAEDWLTVREASERLKVNEDTVRRWLRAGYLRGTRLSGRAGWRVSESEVQRFMEGRQIDADH